MEKGLPGGTSFMEDYTYHLEPGNELILGAHMLEVCPSIAAAKPRVEIHPLGIGDRSDPVRLVFDAAPGAGVTLGLSDLGDRLRFVSNEVEVVAVPHPMPKLPVARAVWRPLPDFATSTQCWLAAGGPHHTVLSTQLNATHLRDLATITGVELALIAGDTSERDFTNALAWTAAAHRLGLPA
jgi:L-arabinose isomerase